MAIVAPIAGAYTATYNRKGAGAAALNYTRQGFNLNFTQKGERIEETDLYALTLIDIVGRGAGLTIDTICKVYSTAVTGALWPWATPLGTVYTGALPLATLASTTPDVIIFTAVAGTPAAASPATLTSKVTLSPDNANSFKLDSTLREVPLRCDSLLIDSPTGTGTLFTAT